jgi:hypothetical protein
VIPLLDWQVTIKESADERETSIAHAFWELRHEWTKINFVHTTKELTDKFGISGAHKLRKIQMAVCTVQAPDTICCQCKVGLRWRAKCFESRAQFQEYWSNWRNSICNDCCRANAEQRQAEQKERERARQAEAPRTKPDCAKDITTEFLAIAQIVMAS